MVRDTGLCGGWGTSPGPRSPDDHDPRHVRPLTSRTRTPTDRVLSGALLVAPLLYLAADSTYAARGWTDATAGVLHVLGAIAYGFVLLRVVSWLPRDSALGVAVLVIGLVGMAGNVAYGFDTIHTSLGDIALVDRSGAALLIKPLGLCFPLSFAFVAWALARLGHRWQGTLVLVAMIAWPVAHIGDISDLAVLVQVALVVAFGSLLWSSRGEQTLYRSSALAGSSTTAATSARKREPLSPSTIRWSKDSASVVT